MSNILTFDVMCCGRYVDTFRMPLTNDLIKEFLDGIAVYDYKKLNKRIKEFVEKKRPSLKYKKYKVCL